MRKTCALRYLTLGCLALALVAGAGRAAAQDATAKAKRAGWEAAVPSSQDTLDVAVEPPAAVLPAPADSVAALPPPPPPGPSWRPPPDSTAAVIGGPIAYQRVARDDVERTGDRTVFQVLSHSTGGLAPQASGTADVGAFASHGSFGVPELVVDGWLVRLPRLEGRGLDAFLLDRLGPAPALSNYASIGELTDHGTASALGPRVIELIAVEPAGGATTRSRVTVHYAGFGLTGGGLTLADDRGRLDYRLGVMNANAGRTGGVDDLSTRLSSIDARLTFDGWDVALDTRNGERDVSWRTATSWRQDDQTLRLTVRRGDSLHTDLRVHTTLLDNRLSGNAVPNVEYRRKGVIAGLDCRPRTALPLFAEVTAERDWLALRAPTETLAPRVERGRVRAGAALPAGNVTARVTGDLRVGERHAAAWGGSAVVSSAAGGWSWDVGVRRRYAAATLDQEVLDIDNGRVALERLDEAFVELAGHGAWHWSVLLARRHLADVPEIVAEHDGKPWPRYTFGGRTSSHTAIRVGALTPPGPFALRLGGWHGHRIVDDALEFAPAFVPEWNARAFISGRWNLFGGDMLLLPRFDARLVGERFDFRGRRLGSYLRLDANLVAVMSEQVDLELSLRNLGGRRYPVPVFEPRLDTYYDDSNRTIVIGVRWRLID